jgi:hypothetical protein
VDGDHTRLLVYKVTNSVVESNTASELYFDDLFQVTAHNNTGLSGRIELGARPACCRWRFRQSAAQ